ncbi:MAG: hypothetical protein NT011_13795 [Kiritimatiellaeota bacterium]|nr:hypothetical protein [Kiritimatiellota bacterium]
MIISAIILLPFIVSFAQSIQLTKGAGNDMEAAWSPCGTKIAFQSDRAGKMDLYILDLKTGEAKLLPTGPGYSFYPAWSPDGKSIAYSYVYFTKTAMEGIENGYNIYLIPAEGGEPLQLTHGLYRDYVPAFTPDGKHIYFSTTRQAGDCDKVNIFSVALDDHKVASVQADGIDVQPSFSPDGKYFAFATIANVGCNWGVAIAQTENLQKYISLIKASDEVFYGPRYSPDGNFIACTGYKVGLSGWQIYLLEIRGERRIQVTTNENGNCRNASWSPDGKELAYESNVGGNYKLYRIRVAQLLASDKSQGNDLDEMMAICTASVGQNQKYVADGNFQDDSAWRCEGTNQWLEIQRSKPRKISKVRIYSGYLDYYLNPSGEGSIKGYRVCYWDGKEWRDFFTPVNDAPRYQGGPREQFFLEHKFKPIATDRLRLIVTASNDTRKRQSAPDRITVDPDKVCTYIREFEIFDENEKIIRF